MRICKVFLIALFVIFVQNLQAQTNKSSKDILYLKNGSVIKGNIVSFISDKNVKIQTADGSIFVFPADEVKKLEKESEEITDTAYSNESAEFYKERNPALACFLSFLIPGAGQLYNNENLKGGLMITFSITSSFAAGFLIASASETHSYSSKSVKTSIAAICILTDVVLWIYGMVDAPTQAIKLNRQHGLVGWNITDKTSLAISPAMSVFENNPTYGLKIGLHF